MCLHSSCFSRGILLILRPYPKSMASMPGQSDRWRNSDEPRISDVVSIRKPNLSRDRPYRLVSRNVYAEIHFGDYLVSRELVFSLSPNCWPRATICFLAIHPRWELYALKRSYGSVRGGRSTTDRPYRHPTASPALQFRYARVCALKSERARIGHEEG